MREPEDEIRPELNHLLEIKVVADDMEDRASDWKALNELFMRMIRKN